MAGCVPLVDLLRPDREPRRPWAKPFTPPLHFPPQEVVVTAPTAPPTVTPSSVPRVCPPRPNRYASIAGLGGNVADGSVEVTMGGLFDQGHTLCSEVDDVLEAISVALGRVPKGANDTRVIVAVRFVNRWRETSILANATCRGAVEEGKRVLKDLNSYLAAVGQQQVAPPNVEVPETESPQSTLKTVKWIAIAGAVTVGAVVVAPVLWQAVVAFRQRRAVMSGLGGVRRRKRRRRNGRR